MASKVYECIAKIADSIIANKDFLTEPRLAEHQGRCTAQPI